MEDGLEGLDLLEQAVGQLLAGADRESRNVIDGLLGIELGALAARSIENVDDMSFQPRKPKLKHGEQADGACANNDDIGGSLSGLHRSPAEKWSAAIWGV
jgi:hypothetical protein